MPLHGGAAPTSPDGDEAVLRNTTAGRRLSLLASGAAQLLASAGITRPAGPPPDPRSADSLLHQPETRKATAKVVRSQPNSAATSGYAPPPPSQPLPPGARLYRDRLPRGRLVIELQRAVGIVPASGGGGRTRLVNPIVRFQLIAHAGTRPDGAGTASGTLSAVSGPAKEQPLHDVQWRRSGDGCAGGGSGGGERVVIHVGSHVPMPSAASLPSDGALPPHPPPLLAYQLVAPGMLSDETLAWGAASLSAFIAQTAPASHDGWCDVSLPLAPGSVPSGSFGQSTGGNKPGSSVGGGGASPVLGTPIPPASPHRYLAVRLRWVPLSPGLLIFTLRDAEWSVNRELFGRQQDPYISIASGLAGSGHVATSSVQADSGKVADFHGQQLRLWMGPDSWGAPLTISAFDKDTFKPDDLIGAASVDAVDAGWVSGDWLGEAARQSVGALPRNHPRSWEREVNVELPMYACDVRGAPCGRLRLGVLFIPAGELCVRVVEARRLASRDSLQVPSPYVSLTLDTGLPMAPGARGAVVARTHTHRGGGAFPTWGATLSLDVLDAVSLTARVMDSDVFLSADEEVGQVTLPLGTLYKSGIFDGWQPLRKLSGWGAESFVGEIHLQLDFLGPPGMPFPHLAPGTEETHDGRERLQRLPFPAHYTQKGRLREGAAAFKDGDTADGANDNDGAPPTPHHPRPRSGAPSRASRSGASGGPPSHSGPMSQRDIEAAFDGLDLDRNRYVGAGELRHILAGMGELVTDAEIDAMLTLVDADGDGMVSFWEFASLMRHPDPSSPSFQEVLRAEVAGAEGGKAPNSAAVSPPDLAPPPPIVLSGAGGKALLVGSNPAARRAAMGRADEMDRRSRKREAAKAFVRATRLQLSDLRRWAAVLTRERGERGTSARASPELLSLAANDPATRMSVDPDVLRGLLGGFASRSSGSSSTPVAKRSSLMPQLPKAPPISGAALGPADPSSDGASTVPTVRELILSLSAFVGASREQRLLLCFELLDADGSGSLSRGELAEVLASQHLLTDPAWVAKKVEAVFALVDADGSGQIDLAEFRTLAKRFGNLLLPDYG